jgi:hypothetical protein
MCFADQGASWAETFSPSEISMTENQSTTGRNIPNLFQGEYSSDSSTAKLHFSGEAGAGFFQTGSEGEFSPNNFLVDEAKLFVEAAIIDDIFVFGELNVITREDPNEKLQLGELYLEFEEVSRLWNQEDLLNIRIGRFDIPFGEEYLTRDAIDNPLISHSLSDLWGVDEGVEIYGSLHKLDYIFAIQNGGEPILKDFNGDKAVVGRLTYNSMRHMHFSVSAMRTGKLDVQRDHFSELWFGNGFLRVLGSPASTLTFQGNVFQGDAHASWKKGHFHAVAGHLHYEDSDTSKDNSRNARYFQLEAIQNLSKDSKKVWYAGARFSRITADGGFPLVGNGNRGRFLFDDNLLSDRLWRFSAGIGYRFSTRFLIKTEFTLEDGRQINGTKRDRENFFGVEAAVRF